MSSKPLIASWMTPALTPGMHALQAQASITSPTGETRMLSENQLFYLNAGALPDRLCPEDFAAIQPPPGSITRKGHIPHVAIREAGLPWATKRMSKAIPVPWLALSLFEISKPGATDWTGGTNPAGKAIFFENAKTGDLIETFFSGNDTLTNSLKAKLCTTNPGESPKPTQRDLLLMDYGLLRRQIPAPSCRYFLTHIRKGGDDPVLAQDEDHTVGMLMSARMVPKGSGRWVAAVLDLRVLEDDALEQEIWVTKGTGVILLPVMFRWEFEAGSAEQAGDFRTLLKKASSSTTLLENSAIIKDTSKTTRSSPWVGPTLKIKPSYQPDLNRLLPATAEDLLETAGFELASAFELGRLLALSRRDVLEALAEASAAYQQARLKLAHHSAYLRMKYANLPNEKYLAMLQARAKEIGLTHVFRTELGFGGAGDPKPYGWADKLSRLAQVEWRGMAGWSGPDLRAGKGYAERTLVYERSDLWAQGVRTADALAWKLQSKDFFQTLRDKSSLSMSVGNRSIEISRYRLSPTTDLAANALLSKELSGDSYLGNISFDKLQSYMQGK